MLVRRPAYLRGFDMDQLPVLSLKRTMGISPGSSSLEILQFGQYFDVIKGCVSLSIGYVSYLAWMVPFGARICWIGLGGSGEVYTLYPS